MDDSGYVMYVLNHWGGISGMMILRMIKHANEKAVLLVPEYVRRDCALKGMLENKIFDSIVFFDDRRFYKIPSEEKMLENITEYFDRLLQENKLDLSAMYYAYIACDMTNSFGIYLLEKKKQFAICEMSRNTTLLRIRYDGAFNDGWMSEPYYRYQKENGLLCGERGKCDIVIYPESDISRIRKDSKRCSVFDFEDYSVLTADQIDRIMSCFDVDLSCLNNDVQLILFSSRNMCNGHSIYNTKQSVYLFQLLLQYFGESKYKRIIKPHPSDTLECFDGYFPEATFLESDFPIELIKISDALKIPELLTITSSGADKISDLVENRTEVGWIFYKISPYLSRLDVCYRLIRENTDIVLVNQSITPKWDKLEDKFTRLFVERNGHGSVTLTNIINNNTCYIRNEPDTSIVNLMDNDSLMLFFEYDTLGGLDLERIVPIKIDFYPMGNSYFDKYNQWIYCYASDPELKRKLELVSMRFSLKKTGQEAVAIGLPISSLFTLPIRFMNIISANLNGRKIITWGVDEKMENDLYNALGLSIEGRIYWNKDLIKTELDYYFPWINDKKDEIYLICWNIKMDNKLSDYFNKNRFIENEDFILITAPPPNSIMK